MTHHHSCRGYGVNAVGVDDGNDAGVGDGYGCVDGGGDWGWLWL